MPEVRLRTIKISISRAVADPGYQLWNSDWLPVSLHSMLAADRYVDQDWLDTMEPVVASDEVQLFSY